MLELALSLWLALAGAPAPAGVGETTQAGPGIPKGWVRYVNAVHRYELWHPPDWEPQEVPYRVLTAFRVPGAFGRLRDFWVVHTPAHEHLSLEQVFERWRPNLATAEGARYYLQLVKEGRLGPNRALEIPMWGTSEYQPALWLLDLGGRTCAVAAEITRAEPIVRTILATMRRLPPAAKPGQPQE